MIKICQTHVFLKDYVHIHQMGSHFVGGYRLDFSPTEQESKTSILQAFRSAHPPQKISKPSLFYHFFVNQTFLVNIYAENTANLQKRAGRDFFGGVQPVGIT